MGCGCNKQEARPARTKKKISIQQLFRRRDTSPCSLDAKDKFYPATVIQAVYDPITGRRLDSVLTMGNHLYLPWEGCLSETLKHVPLGWRRKGLVITTVDSNGRILTRQYDNQCSTACGDITDPDNWRPLTSNEDDRWYKPLSLRQEGSSIVYEAIDQDGKKIAIRTEIDGLFGIKLVDKFFLKTPELAKDNTIYLVPNEQAPGTHREYIKYTKVENGVLVSKLEQLGSASGICGKMGSVDRYAKSLTFEDNTLRLRVGVNPELDPSGSLDEVLEQRIVPEIPASIEERLSALERKEDKDTIFDPSQIVSTINGLRNEINELKAKRDVHVSSGKWLSNDSFELTMTNGDKITVARDVIEEWREITPEVQPLPPAPDVYLQEKDSAIYEDETSIVSNGSVGHRKRHREQLYRNGVAVEGQIRYTTEENVPSVARVLKRGSKPVTTTDVSEETENNVRVNLPVQYENDSNLYVDQDVLLSPAVPGSRKRTVTKTYTKGRLTNTKYGEWSWITEPKPEKRKRGTKARPVPQEPTYKVYMGKYPHKSRAGLDGAPLTEADIKLLPMFEKKESEIFGKQRFVSHENSAFTFAYPKSLGPLTGIIDILGANLLNDNFIKGEITVDGVQYLTYTQDGAFGTTRKELEHFFTFNR